MKTEAVAEDITDDILCDMDNNFVVNLEQVHQDAECNEDYMFTQRPPTLKCIVKIVLFHKPHTCALLHISLNTLYYKQLNSIKLH